MALTCNVNVSPFLTTNGSTLTEFICTGIEVEVGVMGVGVAVGPMELVDAMGEIGDGEACAIPAGRMSLNAPEISKTTSTSTTNPPAAKGKILVNFVGRAFERWDALASASSFF